MFFSPHILLVKPPFGSSKIFCISSKDFIARTPSISDTWTGLFFAQSLCATCTAHCACTISHSPHSASHVYLTEKITDDDNDRFHDNYDYGNFDDDKNIQILLTRTKKFGKG